MFRKKGITNGNKSDTLIGSQVRIEGNIALESGCTQINGYVKGNITAKTENQTTLIINHDALVEGDIEASIIFIQGKLKGSLCAYKKVTLMPKALVNGDVHYQTIEMHLGAKVNGRFICQAESESNTASENHITNKKGKERKNQDAQSVLTGSAKKG